MKLRVRRKCTTSNIVIKYEHICHTCGKLSLTFLYTYIWSQIIYTLPHVYSQITKHYYTEQNVPSHN